MTFTDYIMAQPDVDSARGDFIADAKDEIRRGDFPRDVQTRDRLEGYLIFKHACPEATKAALEVFKAWRSAHEPDVA
jgi:hypothetical protein